MNNGVNENNNQTIPGVKVVMPTDKPVDATTADAGAAVSNAKPVAANVQPTVVNPVVNQTVGIPSVQPQTVVQQVQPNVTVQQNLSSQSVQPSTNVVASSQPSAVLQPAQQANPVITSPVVQNVVSQPVQQVESVQNSSGQDNNKKKKKKPKNKLARFLLFIVFLLVLGCAFMWYYHQQQMLLMNIKCTPVSTTSGSKELDLDSTIVTELYSKVKTNIKEDLGQSELNDELKIYLAYRQIPQSKFYESRCNLFETINMEPFTCQASTTFTPLAFKESDIQLELKKLFGEDANIANQNIQLGNTCIGGYQYIEKRGEYVQGQCQSTGTVLYRVEKELIGAVSNKSTIVLTERVKYYGSEGLEVPSKLVSGIYKYTFKLDMNYNYIFVNKELSE